jgi:lambda family phage tail tape measure protein
MAFTNIVKLVLDDSGMTSGLNKLAGKVDGLNSKFAGLKNALSGLALGSLIQQTLGFADSIQDLSDATGIATGNILGFQTAIQQSGGNADAAGNAILKLINNIEGAANGSAELQGAFAKVGVTLEDLRTLSEQDILKKTIEGLGKIGSVSEQVALKQQLLSKEMRGVAVESLAANYANATRESQKYEGSIKAAAETQARLEAALNQMRLTLLQVIEPLTKFISTIDVKAINTLVEGLVTAGAILLVFKGYALAATAALGALAVSATGATLALINLAKDLIGKFTLIGKIIAGVGLVLTAVKAIFPDFYKSAVDGADNAIKKLKDFLGIKTEVDKSGAGAGRGGNAALTKELQEQGERMAKLSEEARAVTDANEKFYASLTKIVTAYKMTSSAANERFAEETKLIGASEQAKMAASERFAVESRYLTDLAKLNEELAEKTKASAKGDPKAAEAVPKIKAAIDGLTGAYKTQLTEVEKLTAARVKAVQAEQLAIFATKSMAEAQATTNDLANQAANLFLPLQAKGYAELEQAAYRAAKAQIAAEEGRRGAKLDPQEATRYYEAARQGIEEVKKSQEALNDATSRYNLLQFQRKAELDLNKQLRDIQHEMATSTMSAIEKKYEDITHAARENALAAIEAEEARRGSPLNSEEIKAYYDAATVGAEKLKAANLMNYNASRTFASGWKKALNEYADEAGNSAKRAENLFKKATGGMEDYLINRLKGMSGGWKKFTQGMLEELLRTQIQQIFAGLMGGMKDSMGSLTGDGGGGQGGGSSGGGGGILDAISGLFGGAGGGAPGSTPNKPMFVVDVGGGMGAGMMGPMQEGGGGLFDSIMGLFGDKPEQLSGPGYEESSGGFFDTLTSGLGDFFSGFSGPQQLGGPEESGGGFFDSIGSLFDGFFANGGQIGAGKFGVVGENGPELVSGPANVTPMSGGSNVTFNINAVDAQSFKSMIAADPGFLYGVAMQGAKGIPMRS